MLAWIERQRYILDLALSSLLRRKAKNVALLLVYTLVIFLMASVVLFSHALKQEAALVLREAPDIVVQRSVTGRFDMIPTSYVETIRAIRGVVEVRPRLWGYHYDPVVGANYTLLVPPSSSLADREVAIGAGVSRGKAAFVGDSLSFRAFDGRARRFKVAEILSADAELVSADLILITETGFRQVFGVPEDRATDLAVRVPNDAERLTVAQKIAEQLPDARPILRDEILRTYDAVFDWRGGVVVVILGTTFLAFVILAWDKATGLSAEERREVGVLKAVGWETGDVLLMKFWEGAAVSALAFLIGTILAYGHIFFGSGFLFAPILKGWSTLYPEFRLAPFWSAKQIVTLFCLTVLPYTVATIVPSWRIATIDPTTVMK